MLCTLWFWDSLDGVKVQKLNAFFRDGNLFLWKQCFLFQELLAISGTQYLWPCGQQWCGLVASTKMSLRPHIFSSIPFGFMYQGFELNASCAATFYNRDKYNFAQVEAPKPTAMCVLVSMTFLLGRNKFQGKLSIKASYIFRRGGEMFLLCCPKAWFIILKVERMVYFLSTKCWNYPIV